MKKLIILVLLLVALYSSQQVSLKSSPTTISQSDRKELKRMLNVMQKAMKNPGSTIDKFFKFYDKNKDGKINNLEFRNIIKQINKSYKVQPIREFDIDILFKRIAGGKNGKLSKSEVTMFFINYVKDLASDLDNILFGQGRNDLNAGIGKRVEKWLERIDAVFDECDKDKNGILKPIEYRDFLKGLVDGGFMDGFTKGDISIIKGLLDQNRDKKVSKDEVDRLFAKLLSTRA